MSFWDQFEEVPEQNASTAIAVQEPQSLAQNAVVSKQVPSDFWSQFEEVPQKETTGQMISRNVAGALGTAFSSALGLPGDIEQLGRSIISGRQEGEGGLVGKISPEAVLPTSQRLKERFEEAHPELKPKGKTEEIIREVAGDYVLAPGGLARKLAISAFGVLGKEAAKELGAGEKGQIGAKIISGILSSRLKQPNVKDFFKKEYSKASAAIPKDASISSSRAQTYLKQVKEKVNQGGHASWKDEVNKQINALEKNISNGKIKVTALDQSVKDINSQIAEKVVRGSQAEMWLSRIKKAAQHELKQYGKENPEFLKHYKDANAAYAGFSQSKIAQRAVDKFKDIGLIKGSIGLLAEAAFKPELAMQTLGFLSSAYGIKKSGELIMRIFSNPVLANYYLKATSAAAKENFPLFIANIKKIDSELKKEKSTNQNMKKVL